MKTHKMEFEAVKLLAGEQLPKTGRHPEQQLSFEEAASLNTEEYLKASQAVLAAVKSDNPLQIHVKCGKKRVVINTVSKCSELLTSGFSAQWYYPHSTILSESIANLTEADRLLRETQLLTNTEMYAPFLLRFHLILGGEGDYLTDPQNGTTTKLGYKGKPHQLLHLLCRKLCYEGTYLSKAAAKDELYSGDDSQISRDAKRIRSELKKAIKQLLTSNETFPEDFNNIMKNVVYRHRIVVNQDKIENAIRFRFPPQNIFIKPIPGVA